MFVFLVKIAEFRAISVPELISDFDNQTYDELMTTYNDIIRIGKEKGVHNTNIRHVLRLHEKNYSVPEIAETLDLTIDFVKGVIDGTIKPM